MAGYPYPKPGIGIITHLKKKNSERSQYIFKNSSEKGLAFRVSGLIVCR